MNPGDIVAGKYRIERVLGEGGMGTVLAATHLHLDEKVAIKILLPELLGKAGITERFMREARSAVKLKSEHVGRIMDVATFDDGSPYIVMEYLEGCDLGSMIKANGALPAEVAAHYVLQACEALAEAHAAGIIHRDIKPPNLFLTQRPDGSPLIKVLDFGIAKAASTESDFQLTQTGAVFGSPGYMSPEQLRSARTVDARTDIWALGVVLYELVSGRPPFDAETFSELCLKVAMDPFTALPNSVHKSFAQIVYRCLAKSPDGRYKNVAELAAALVPFAPPHAGHSALRTARMLRVETPMAATVAAPHGGHRPVTPTPVPAVGTVPSAPQAMQHAAQAVQHAPQQGYGPGAAGKPTTLSAAASESRVAGSDNRGKKIGALVAAVVVAGVIGVSIALVVGGDGAPSEPAAATQPEDAADAQTADPGGDETTEAAGDTEANGDTGESRDIEATEAAAGTETAQPATTEPQTPDAGVAETEPVKTAKKSGTKRSGTKRSGTKRSGTKKSGTKRSGTKKSGTKKSGTKKSGTKESTTTKTNEKKSDDDAFRSRN